MLPAKPQTRSSNGWRGVALIAITYVYFLIFAQFAFLKRLAVLGIANNHLKAVMAAMALGGILLSLVAPRIRRFASPALRVRSALAACAAAAFLTQLPLSFVMSLGVAVLIGGALGLLTVTLVTHLRRWIGSTHHLLKVGLGTGIGYFLCNIPRYFAAASGIQATIAADLCLIGILLTNATPEPDPTPLPAPTSPRPIGFPRVLACFTALVWLDSAAFFIIQNTPALKAGTWQGSAHLWVNGSLHFVAALGAVWLLRRGLAQTLSFAFFALAAACLLLLDPNRALLASVFYPIGVSLYSVALVAYPSLLSPAASSAERGKRVGWIYAIAGWGGSAMGIGMGQNLGHVPWAFVLAAGLVILAPVLWDLLRTRPRELAAIAFALLAALGIERILPHSQPGSETAALRGRHVYISEGCISCHSQYVRPQTRDVLLWGPVQTIEELRREHPPLIGNRRQGPDLTQIGSRRSVLWLRAHFYNPAEVSHASFMPVYAYLFRDQRGDDLIAYLQSLQGSGVAEHRIAESAWQPADWNSASASRGQTLFATHCSTCHADYGLTRLRWLSSFQVLPPSLPRGPYRHLNATMTAADRKQRLAQIIKFGLPGTDMPGHEYFSDQDIASITLWLAQNTAQPIQQQ